MEGLVFRCLEKYEVIVSEILLAELSERLKNKAQFPYRFRRMIRQYMRVICEVADIEYDATAPKVRDPKDLHVLAAAINGSCDLVITGDKDLLDLNSYQGVGIINPAEFLDLMS